MGKISLSRFHINQQYQCGQILLIIVLVMVVALTVGLAAATRSVTNLRITREEENSQKAFSAAEAGIEHVLKNRTGITDKKLSNEAFIQKAEIRATSATEIILNDGKPVLKDDGVDLWLSTYPDFTGDHWGGELTVYWGKEGDTCGDTPDLTSQAALEIVVIKGPDKKTPDVEHYALDPCRDRKNFNKFEIPTGGKDTLLTQTFAHNHQIQIDDGMIARIVPLYHNTPIGVRGETTLPSQGDEIESTGEYQDSVHKITLFRGYPKIPNELFTFVLFNPLP